VSLVCLLVNQHPSPINDCRDAIVFISSVMPGGCSLFSRSRRASLLFSQTYNYQVDHEDAPPITLPWHVRLLHPHSTFHYTHMTDYSRSLPQAPQTMLCLIDLDLTMAKVIDEGWWWMLRVGGKDAAQAQLSTGVRPYNLMLMMGVLLEMFRLVGWVYVLTCTHTFWLYQH
jgi:hypothetical protein